MHAEKEKPKVEGIYPLSFFQQALLFHSLQEETRDQGFLQVQCTLKGKLDLEKFKEAWRQTIKRHEALRTSVHWENIERSVQVVHKEADLPFAFHDWSEISSSSAEQEEKISLFKEKEREDKLDLSSAPVLRIALIKLSEDKHFFLWSCHHILADGWSASIILQDLFYFYDAAVKNKEGDTDLNPLPSMRDYLSFVKKQDLTLAESFWKENLEGFEKPSLVGIDQASDQANNYESKTIALPADTSDDLRDFARKNRVTLNTLIHGLWAILISRYLQNDDILFGTTVSGRSIELADAERMAGMYMNVLPVRTKIKGEADFTGWLNSLQEKLAKIRNYEYLSLDKILSWKNLPGNHSMFDSLVVFENIPLESLTGGGVSVEDFSSGLTTAYPLTLAVKPRQKIEFFIKYNSSRLSEKNINWWSENLLTLIESIEADSTRSLPELLDKIPPPSILVSKEPETASNLEDETDYAAPGNNTELELVKIWENLFDRRPIGINDNFFELGGRSIIAVRMFAQIEKSLNRNLPPTTLLQNPTIEKLARLIRDEKSEKSWSSLVPIRATGTKPPVFCMHAGGAHVLYYKTLTDHLDTNQPVYGIQPLGLDGLESPHESVEEMASHYLAEIKKLQPAGPYFFVGYCFSNAVCIEMAIQLQKMGESNFKIIIIDSHPMFMPHNETLMPTFWEKFQSYRRLIGQKNWNEIYQRSEYKIRRAKKRINNLFKTNGMEKSEENSDSKQRRNLQETQDALEKAYRKYEWNPFDSKVSLILAGNFETHPWSRVVIDQWETLALGGVEYSFVQGNHVTLFEEPEVQRLAERLQKYLDEDLEKNVVASSN